MPVVRPPYHYAVAVLHNAKIGSLHQHADTFLHLTCKSMITPTATKNVLGAEKCI